MNPLKKTLATLTLIATTLVVFMAFRPEGGYKPGDAASDFKLKNVNGKMVSMADNKSAKGFIVVFTCNHCPFSQAYEQRIIALHKKYADKGYPVIAINPNDKDIVPEDSFEEMQKRAKENKYPFPYLWDETQATARSYGAVRTPHVFVVQKEGDKFMVRYIGAIDDNADDPAAVKDKYVETAVNELLEGKSVKQNFTKAIGCTIKWGKN